MLNMTKPVSQLHGYREDLWPPETERPTCTICRQRINGQPYPMKVVLDLGEQPLANALLTSPDDPCPRYPLQLAECASCGHVQLAQTVRPDLLFDHYTYRTGVSRTMRLHFAQLACEIRKELVEGARVCEVGCNDGTLLRSMKTAGLQVYGVDPSSVSQSVEGVEIIPRYFTKAYAEELQEERGSVDCVVMTNVLAHVPDPHELIRGAWALLKDRGLLVLEFPYVRDLVARNAWDTIYHEHAHFFSLKDIQRLLIGAYWRVEAERLPCIHGGSLRISAIKTRMTHLPLWRHQDGWQELNGDTTWEELRRRELCEPINWPAFQHGVEVHVNHLREVVSEAKDLVGLFAPAKATVLLNHCDLRPNRVIEDTPEKQGKFIPGVNVPIVPRAELGDPDLALLLAWNFRQEVQEREVGLRGRMICPLPDIVRF